MPGSFYIGFERDDGLPGLRKDAALDTANIDRIAIAYGKLYFPNGVEETPASPGDPTADPPIAPTAAVMRAPTGLEIFDAMARGLLQGILDNTLRVEKDEAAHAEAAKVPEIQVVIS
jgi:hypothetical protein